MAAARVPQVLELADLYVVPEGSRGGGSADAINDIIEQNIELLAEAEHDGWMEQKKKNGWTWGERRDDANKIHNALVLYKELYEHDREKDRNSVHKFGALLKKAGYKIATGSH